MGAGGAVIPVVLGGLAIALELHGLGRLVGWVLGDDDAPAALTIAWGLALYLALGGWLAAAGLFTGSVQLAIMAVGVLLGPLWALWRCDVPSAPRRRLPGIDRVDAAVIGLTVIMVLVQLAAAAGARHADFADGDAYLLGPLARMAQTGEPGDGGALHGAGLGGSVIVTSLGWALDDWRASHAVDSGLAFGLTIALAFGLRGTGPLRRWLGVTIAALAVTVPELPPDLAPRWTVVALVLATYATWRRAADTDAPRLFAAAALAAAAAAAVRHGALALAAVAVIAAPPRRRAAAAAVVGLGLLPYLLIAFGAGAGVAVSPSRLAVAGAGALVMWAALTSATRELADRPLDLVLAALAAGLAVTAAAAPSWIAAALFAVPVILAIVLLFVIAALRPLAGGMPRLTPAALVALVSVVMAFSAVRVKFGSPSYQWGDRLAARIDAVRALSARELLPDARERAAYTTAFAAIPTGARVGIWVDRADLVDYRAHAIVDLRRPPSRRAPPIPPDLEYLVIAPSTRLPPRAAVVGLAAAGQPLGDTGDLTVLALRR